MNASQCTAAGGRASRLFAAYCACVVTGETGYVSGEVLRMRVCFPLSDVGVRAAHASGLDAERC